MSRDSGRDSLMGLPRDVQLDILSNLEREDLLRSCHVNREWGEICRDERLWKRLVVRDFGIRQKIIGRDNTWYSTYILYYQIYRRFSEYLIENTTQKYLYKTLRDFIDMRGLTKHIMHQLMGMYRNLADFRNYNIGVTHLAEDLFLLNQGILELTNSSVFKSVFNVTKYRIHYFFYLIFGMTIPQRSYNIHAINIELEIQQIVH